MATKKENSFDPAVLTSWASLHAEIHTFTEEQLSKMLTYEKNNKNRTQILLRLHAKFNKLRADRERRELFGS